MIVSGWRARPRRPLRVGEARKGRATRLQDAWRMATRVARSSRPLCVRWDRLGAAGRV